jgi:hypothetical protein
VEGIGGGGASFGCSECDLRTTVFSIPEVFLVALARVFFAHFVPVLHFAPHRIGGARSP